MTDTHDTPEPRSWTSGDDREFLSAVDVPDRDAARAWFVEQGCWNELPIKLRIEPRLVCDHEIGDPHPSDCVQVWERVWTIDQ